MKKLTDKQKKERNEKIKRFAIKTIHGIGYISIGLVLLFGVVTGVTSCNNRKQQSESETTEKRELRPSKRNANSDSTSSEIDSNPTGATIMSVSNQGLSFKYPSPNQAYKEFFTGEVTNNQYERWNTLLSSDYLENDGDFVDGFLEIQPAKFSVYCIDSERAYGEPGGVDELITSMYQYSYTKYVVKTPIFNMKYNYNFDLRYFYHFDATENPLTLRVKCASAIWVNPYHDLESIYKFNVASENNNTTFFRNYNELYSYVLSYNATTFNRDIEILRDGATYQDNYITDTQNYYLNGALLPGDTIYMVTCNEIKFTEYPNMGHYNYDDGVQAYGNLLNRLYQFGYSYNYYNYSGGTQIQPGEIDNAFSLLTKAFSGMAGILDIKILPGITIGVLMFVPLVVTIIIVIIRLIKK